MPIGFDKNAIVNANAKIQVNISVAHKTSSFRAYFPQFRYRQSLYS